MIGRRKRETFECPRRAEAPFRLPGDDGKDTWRKGVGLVDQERGCSYCGSMNPDDFLAAVKAGSEVGPTDKNYKVYLDGHAGKFYLQHLSEAQRREFFDLYKDKTMKVGYPGYFYVLPFFMRPAGARFVRSVS